jgi:hypothetical protein
MLENIHDVAVSQTSRFTLGGKVVPSVVVRYYAGDHGPFEDNYDQDQATPENIQKGYATRVLQLHAAGAALPSPPQETMPGSGEYKVTGRPSPAPIGPEPWHPIVWTGPGTVKVNPPKPVGPAHPTKY